MLILQWHSHSDLSGAIYADYSGTVFSDLVALNERRIHDQGEAYRIVCDGKISGGVVIHVEKCRGFLDLLFTLPDVHSKGIGYGAWCEGEEDCGGTGMDFRFEKVVRK